MSQSARNDQPKRSGKIVTTLATEDVWKFENHWNSDLCDCCSDCKKCCCWYWCFPCCLCNLYRRAGEYWCSPLILPHAVMNLRTKIRTGFRISGSILEDCACAGCCPCCIAIQIEKELDFQGL